MNSAAFDHPHFPDYELLDSGAGEKLERFGQRILRRPDPQALWSRALPSSPWGTIDLVFVRESDRGGRWESRRGAKWAAEQCERGWEVEFEGLRCMVRPTPFKHVGLFPEQSANWHFVAERFAAHAGSEPPRLLNLFGYSGVASVHALRAGADVTHVDASRLAIAWLRENQALNGLDRAPLRYVLEDALAFAQREARRGSKYDGILLDPPNYGRGPKGQKWVFGEQIAALIKACAELVSPGGFCVLSTYAIGFTALSLARLLEGLGPGRIEARELALPETSGPGRLLPAGLTARWVCTEGPVRSGQKGAGSTP